MAANRVPAETDRVLVSVNPLAGASSAHGRALRLADLLGVAGFHVEIHTDLATVAERAAEYFAAGTLRALVAVGGDGTVSELVNRTPPGLPIAVLPAGTENLLARQFALPRNPEGVAELIQVGETLRVDAGMAGARIFLVMLSCGFDAAVVHHFHRRRAGHIRKMGYFASIAATALGYSFPRIRVYWEEQGQPGGARELEARWMFAFNMPRYGGGLAIAPQADSSDGLLDVCTFSGAGFRRGLYMAAMIGLARHHNLPGWTTFRARHLRIASDEQVPCQVDGDPAGHLPQDVEVLPDRLTLFVPKALP